jgi:RimJ/RimL family protein N-acetyltransferase
MNTSTPFTLTVPSLRLTAHLVPWDTDCFGFAVAQIDTLECLHSSIDSTEILPFYQWLDNNAIRLVSCRLSFDRLNESMLLERCGFRFIETVLHPHLDLFKCSFLSSDELKVAPATTEDLPMLEAMAAEAFAHGRIHADPRLGQSLGGRRYSHWVRNTLTHPSQKLLKVTDKDANLVALFITEERPEQSLYWHLTAIALHFQGKGYGWRVWQTMLAIHARDGMSSVQTTITAGNVPVLNLYAKLGFRFFSPEMTFHWVRE